MANYALKYLCTFDPIGPVSATPVYRTEIFQKDYDGEASNIIGSAIPVLHKWETDDPKAPIKGSSLSMSFINDGLLPLISFYSNEDDGFKVRHYYNNQLLFEGFLVQDDCSEVLLDFAHEINLSANDNLGLLKDAGLDQSNVFIPKSTYPATSIAADKDTGTIILPGTVVAEIGNQLIITGGTPIDGVYLVTGVTPGMPTANITVTAPLPANYIGTATLNFGARPSLLNKTTLLSIIQMCLSVTNLQLSTYIYSNIFSVSQVTEKVAFGANPSGNIIVPTIPASRFRVGDILTISGSLSNDGAYTITAIDPDSYIAVLTVAETVSTLELDTQNVSVSYTAHTWCFYTLIDPQTLLKDDINYYDCYTVLTKILDRFNMSLFQANGVWNIVRWDELRKSSNLINAFAFDYNFTPLPNATLGAPMTTGPGENTKPGTGLIQKAVRPFLYDKETFNYKQPPQLLRNFNLLTLGSLLNTYTTGSGLTLKTIREYTATWWDASTRLDAGSGDYFIRVTDDYLGNEIERLLVVKHDVKSYHIEANIGDAFQYSFAVKTQDNQPGNINLVMIVELTDGTTTKYLHEDTGWESGIGYVYNIPSGENSNEWHNVQIDSTQFPVPFDGYLYFYLRIADLSGTINETYYRDIRLNYIWLINESTKVIGHTHKDSQSAVIKLNEDIEIFTDSSPRNTIAGTLFLPEFNGVLQQKTALWELFDVTNKRLGEITTTEQLFWRRVQRTILEGTMYGLVNTVHLSLINVFHYNQLPGFNFVFGMPEIDYKNDKVTGTFWEIWQDGETDADLSDFYEYKYLYAVK